MRKTIFIDIDGTILEHNPKFSYNKKVKILPGVKKAFDEWNKKEYKIILTTGRRENDRDLTVKQLQKLELSYDHLIMGLGRGERVLINDIKPDGTITAKAINVKRDSGFGEEIIKL